MSSVLEVVVDRQPEDCGLARSGNVWISQPMAVASSPYDDRWIWGPVVFCASNVPDWIRNYCRNADYRKLTTSFLLDHDDFETLRLKIDDTESPRARRVAVILDVLGSILSKTKNWALVAELSAGQGVKVVELPASQAPKSVWETLNSETSALPELWLATNCAISQP